MNIFVLFVIVIAATNFIQMLFRYLQAVVSTKLSYKMVYQFSNGIFQKIFCSEYKNYSNIDSAYYIDQISKDTNTIVGFFTSNVVKFFLQVATVIMSAVIVFRADRTLSIIILYSLAKLNSTPLWNLILQKSTLQRWNLILPIFPL